MKLVPSFKEAVDRPAVKALMLKDPERFAEVEKQLQEELDGELSAMRSKPFFLELTEPGVTKGASLDRLINTMGITAEEVIAVGCPH